MNTVRDSNPLMQIRNNPSFRLILLGVGYTYDEINVVLRTNPTPQLVSAYLDFLEDVIVGDYYIPEDSVNERIIQ